MKPMFWIGLALTALMGACQPNENASNSTPVNPLSDPNQYAPPPTTGTGSYVQPVPANMASSQAQALTRGYWIFEKYVDPQTPTNNRAKVGRWYKFNPDGTFASGHWDQQTAVGSWGLGANANYAILSLDSSVDAEDSEYELQGINVDEDAMSWVGTDRFDQGHIMLKAINLTSMPTRKQFGLE